MYISVRAPHGLVAGGEREAESQQHRVKRRGCCQEMREQVSVAGDPLHLEGQDESALFPQAAGVRTRLTASSLNLHYVRAPRTLSRTMGFYFGGKKAWEAVPLFSLNLLHLPSGHILCPVHEAPLTDQLHLGSWEETAVHCGRCFGSPLERETDTFRGRVSKRPLPPLVTFI